MASRRCSAPQLWISSAARRNNTRLWTLYPPRHAQDEDQNLGHRLVEFDWNFLADLDVGKRRSETRVVLDWDAVRLCGLDDLLAERTAAAGDDPRRGAVLLFII